MRLTDDKLRGASVITADGQAIGEVVAMLLDVAGWRVEALLVKLRTEAADQIGVAHSVFHAATMELPVRVVQSVGDAILLTVALRELQQVPAGSR